MTLDDPTSASSRLFSLPELLNSIFLHLPYTDLLHCRAICVLWKHCIDVPLAVRQRMWKAPTKTREGEEPHFEVVSEKAGKVVYTQGNAEWHGRKILEKSQEIRLAFLSEAIPGQEMPTGKYATEMQESRNYAMRSVNFQNEWPDGYCGYVNAAEIVCSLCDRFHTRVRFENLHPILQFLEAYEICFTGVADRLIVEYGDMYCPAWIALRCFGEFGRDMLSFARGLRRAMENAHLHDDLFINPPVTLVAAPETGRAVAATGGLLVRDILLILLELFHYRFKFRAAKTALDLQRAIKNELHIRENNDREAQIAPSQTETALRQKIAKTVVILERFLVTMEDINDILHGVKGWSRVDFCIGKEFDVNI
ncbi:uncharacterized protein CC84DRAFT_1210353 [Paraphaeosphaeria sporulosa]|uniref:F-box domain-containing protein n=1 Tax=Paraphaeosphaeria sporulosa TaxID=1460663 RepID=A0A177BW37_9PLEO|nr:uncharacterized protein CC84DRAFT_1210353 [Paraphaeosphaeria sporulosa]OAF99514.1 hypothetical protein CC84DRAFT_1210353 [Paraphaeosphaeria sporulosa]